MAQEPQKSVAQRIAGLSEEHRRMVAAGLATMHRFSPEPAFKHGKPQYKHSHTVEAIAHAKSKRGR